MLGVGYPHGSSSLAGGKDMYVATIGYWGPAEVLTPMCPDETWAGDHPHTDATGYMSGHTADCTIETEFNDIL